MVASLCQSLCRELIFAAESECAVLLSDDSGCSELAILPGDAELVAATCLDTAYLSFRPCVWQGWEEVDVRFVVCDGVTLHEHLHDAGCHTEVAVNLEWWMRVEEIGEGAAIRELSLLAFVGKESEHVADDGEGMVAIEHACPEVGLPPEAPSCGLVTSLFECNSSCLPEVRSLVGRYLVRGVKAVEMGDVTMLIAWVIKVFPPLLQLSVLSHFHRGQHGDSL